MKNPNSPANRLKNGLRARWSAEDHPGGEPRFQLRLFAKDLGAFVLLPILAIIIFKTCEGSGGTGKRPNAAQQVSRDGIRGEQSKSQIIDFHKTGSSSPLSGIVRRTPGAVVKVRLLNVIETYSTAPVHAQIIDSGLGNNLVGGTLIGDAVADSNFERININFKYAKDPSRENIAVPLSARALGLDGTLGLIAAKKEGFFTRSALGSAGTVHQDLQGRGGSSADFKDVLVKALTAGLIQEFGSEGQVERNRAQVLTLTPSTEFLAELTDFFPGTTK